MNAQNTLQTIITLFVRDQMAAVPSNLEPQAGLSCASACIRMRYANDFKGRVFKPVYTHQIFEDEVIRGFQPFLSDIQEAKELAGKRPVQISAELAE
jgi:hypothetical protein